MKRLVFAALIAAGCGGNANVAGNYTVATTNRDNGCNIGGFTVGDTNTGIAVTITQSGEAVTATVTGFGGALALDALLGANGNVLTGTIDGDSIDLTHQGTRAQSSGNCTYTYNGRITATLSGDTLTGRITYNAATNGNSDCATISGCVTYQDFNGTRPPR